MQTVQYWLAHHSGNGTHRGNDEVRRLKQMGNRERRALKIGPECRREGNTGGVGAGAERVHVE